MQQQSCAGTLADLPSIALYFTAGSSDKEYHAQVQEKEGGYVVNFQYGRRGSALKAGAKTATPVSLEEALAIYNSLVEEKTGKGYSPSQSGVAFEGTDKAGQVTGVALQLLNAVPEQRVPSLIANPSWMAQQKYDGERRSVRCLRADNSCDVQGINRKGLAVALPQPVVQAAMAIGFDFVIDGEIVGNKVYAFDILELGGEDLRSRSAEDRYLVLLGLAPLLEKHRDAIEVAPCAFSAQEKQSLFDRLKEANQEGVVFKEIHSPYEPGRPANDGNALKFKFCESATLEVAGVNGGKRSVEMRGYDEQGQPRALGNVTIPPNFPIPQEGALIEVRYLYAYENGSLFQPVYLGERFDQDLSACTLSQLKYKADHANVEVEEAVTSSKRMRP